MLVACCSVGKEVEGNSSKKLFLLNWLNCVKVKVSGERESVLGVNNSRGYCTHAIGVCNRGQFGIAIGVAIGVGIGC